MENDPQIPTPESKLTPAPILLGITLVTTAWELYGWWMNRKQSRE